MIFNYIWLYLTICYKQNRMNLNSDPCGTPIYLKRAHWVYVCWNKS